MKQSDALAAAHLARTELETALKLVQSANKRVAEIGFDTIQEDREHDVYRTQEALGELISPVENAVYYIKAMEASLK